MSGWVTHAPAFLATLALLILPGLPTALLTRTRGVLRLGIAIVLSVAIIAAASIAAPLVGMAWSPLPVIAVAVVVTAIAAVIRWAGRRGAPARQPAAPKAIWATLAAGFLGWTVILVLAIVDPAHPSQLYDGIFHINAVEFIAQTGSASPFDMTMAYPGRASIFYPTGWHALVSLVLPLTGSAVVATNVVTVALIALAWPVVLSALTLVILPTHRAAAVWAPLVAFGFSVFPLGFLNWGVLYPNLIGDLMLPMLIALVVLACRRGESAADRILLILLAIAAAGATALGHPSALLAGIVLLMPFGIWHAWRGWRIASARSRVVLVVAVVVAAAMLAATWHAANVTTEEWLPSSTLAQALGEVAFLSPVGRTTGLLIGPLAALGIWRLVRDRRWWVLGMYGVSVLFFVIAAWMPVLRVRSAFVGIWYDDTTRVAAILAVSALPIAALGASIVVSWLGELRQRRGSAWFVAALLVLAIAAATHLLALRADLRFARDVAFRFDEESQGLSPDEAALFEEAAAIVPDDSPVVGDPLTGAAFFLAYTGHDVVFPHAGGAYGDDAKVLALGLADGGAAVCAAAERMGVEYAFDFGDRVMFENFGYSFAGLHELAGSDAVTEVARVGDAALYRLTGCLR
ncbi:hypothetical protein Q9R19_03795 [Microbacterium sp. ARD32]|uniref:DUF6541 family protein n=1 Tax=Microbacterium sp. ARD32 TaxID=2962577 RepID=UPI002880EC8A|nr:DUF6541 family protein [Microbacterium sp. ARD32]MDT0156744.1 hypothetical protein [Microbacterium sp. ARD32]